ncbi:hypothetical protein AURDEDRAFT_184477 [Auricularia subglabra TFB-10046 SS5]|nr:hypothetical protein AURDEDRAFT_184477 [Auricularia subglabra TFB-10046 SS5]
MTALTPAFVLIALAVSAAAGPVPGRQAPFAVAKRDYYDNNGALVDVEVLSHDPDKASLLDVDTNRSPRLSSRLFGRSTRYGYNPATGNIEVEQIPDPLVSVDLLGGHSYDSEHGSLLDLDLLRRQTTGDIISPDPSGQDDTDAVAEAHKMRSRAVRAVINQKLNEAKNKSKNTAEPKTTTVASTPGRVKAVVAAQQPAVTPNADSTASTTTIVPVDTNRGSLIDLDILGRPREAAVYSQPVAAAPVPASAAVAPPAAVVSTVKSSTGNSGGSGLVLDPNQIKNAKFAKSGPAKVQATTGQDVSLVSDAAAPVASTVYTTPAALLGVDVL